MRNGLAGKVHDIRHGATDDTVELELMGGHRIVADLPSECTRKLGIHPGSRITAFIKTPWIVTDATSFSQSGRNQLEGVVDEVRRNPMNSDVVIKLRGGIKIVANMEEDRVQLLDLHIGKAVNVIVKAAHVDLVPQDYDSSKIDTALRG